MVINKTATALTSPLAISHFSAAATSVHVHTYDASNLTTIVHGPNGTISNGSFTTTYPADSITLLALPVAGP